MSSLGFKPLILAGTLALSSWASAECGYQIITLDSLGSQFAGATAISSGFVVGTVQNGSQLSAVAWDLNTYAATVLGADASAESISRLPDGANVYVAGTLYGAETSQAVYWTWNGSSWSAGNPLGGIFASGVDGNVVVGQGGLFDAMKWLVGPTVTQQQLTTSGFGAAYDVAGGVAVGYDGTAAVTWSQSNVQSFLPSPPGLTYFQSVANATNGVAHGGSGDAVEDGFRHATLWPNNTTAIDLNPPGTFTSSIEGMNALEQVGYTMDTNYVSRATLWKGTAASATQLPQDPSWVDSRATGIDAFGNIVGVAGTATGSSAILWKKVEGTPQFGSFKWPLSACTTYPRGVILPVRLSLTNCEGSNAAGEDVVLTLKYASGPNNGQSVPAWRYTAPWHMGNHFYYASNLQEYIYLMPTLGLQRGSYTLTASLAEDGSVSKSIVITIN